MFAKAWNTPENVILACTAHKNLTPSFPFFCINFLSSLNDSSHSKGWPKFLWQKLDFGPFSHFFYSYKSVSSQLTLSLHTHTKKKNNWKSRKIKIKIKTKSSAFHARTVVGISFLSQRYSFHGNPLYPPPQCQSTITTNLNFCHPIFEAP